MNDPEIIGQFVLIVIGLAVGLTLYFIPAYIGRNNRNSGAILVLNIFLGWTLLGWVAALVWALTVEKGDVKP